MGLTRNSLVVFVAIASAITSTLPASAIPLSLPAPHAAQFHIEVQPVQYRERHWHGHRRHGWYGGHRGYRHHRHGYRRHSDGWWYPLAAFGAGAVIGGAIANSNHPPVRDGISPSHYDWCASRYRTYRAYDNTYVPYAGARALCRSPYY
jgi:hypothetical protein